MQRGNATLEMILAITLGIIALTGIILVSWLLSVKSVMQSLASEAASIIAHQQIHLVENSSERGSPALERLQNSLHEQIRNRLGNLPLVSLFTNGGLGIRLSVKRTTAIDQDTVVSIYLCLPPLDSLPQLDSLPSDSSRNHSDRDCLGQFSKDDTPAQGTWLFVQSTQPPLASSEIYSKGLSNLPLESERETAVQLLKRNIP